MTFTDELKRWRETILKKTLDRFPERRDEFETSSGIPVPRLGLPAQPFDQTPWPDRQGGQGKDQQQPGDQGEGPTGSVGGEA